MINSKNLTGLWVAILLVIGSAGYSSVSRAGGMAVIDISNIKQTTIIGLRSINRDDFISICNRRASA